MPSVVVVCQTQSRLAQEAFPFLGPPSSVWGPVAEEGMSVGQPLKQSEGGGNCPGSQVMLVSS